MQEIPCKGISTNNDKEFDSFSSIILSRHRRWVSRSENQEEGDQKDHRVRKFSPFNLIRLGSGKNIILPSAFLTSM